MSILQYSKSIYIFLALFVSFHFPTRLQGSEYDFRELLSGFGVAGSKDLVKEEVRSTLRGRESEVWDFVKIALRAREEYDSGDVTGGLMALIELDGFSDSILSEYLEMLQWEASNATELIEFDRDRTRGGATFREVVSMSKRELFIALGFYVFSEYADGLPREIASQFLWHNDRSMMNQVIRWYRAYGTEQDVDALSERADDLEARGATIFSDSIREVIEEIRFRSVGAGAATDASSADLANVVSDPAASADSTDPQELESMRDRIRLTYALVAVTLIVIFAEVLRSTRKYRNIGNQ